ncbi:hypothetical protein [Rhizobium sp. GN54]|uniref:hypothetical protein n=1 Tax=Rhizobium sp. GN54 TaxID=2898150 RepID=UPI001E460242|nr:hypothetical protein [Rhizobium sp. GN54]MCD2181070.1 hypothetical protein [Rhizobium sp. GN54]
MLSAVPSLYAAAYPPADVRPLPRSARTDAAAAAIAALAPVRPVPSVSDGADDGRQALAFLYGPNGQPAAPPPAQTGSTASQSANDGDASARLAMESTQVTALLSSLMAPGAAAAKQADAGAQPQANAATPEPLISQFYRQF